MKIILRYFKPFWFMALISIVLLLSQDIANLFLPRYMSEMIDTGIIRGGVSEGSPRALSEEAYGMILPYFTDDVELKGSGKDYSFNVLRSAEEKAAEFQAVYEKIEIGQTSKLTNSEKKTFPELGVTYTGYVMKSGIDKKVRDSVWLSYSEAASALSAKINALQMAKTGTIYKWYIEVYLPAWQSDEIPSLDIASIPYSVLYTAYASGELYLDPVLGKTETPDPLPKFDSKGQADTRFPAPIAGTLQSDKTDYGKLESSVRKPDFTFSDTYKIGIGASFSRIFYVELGASANSIQQSSIMITGIIMLAITIGVAIITIFNGFFRSRISSGIGRNLRRDMFAKIQTFSPSEFDKFGTATLITRSTSDVSGVQQIAMMALQMILSAPINGIGGIIMAISLNPSMSWIMIVAVVILLGLQFIMFSKISPKFAIMRKLEDKLNRVARETLSGMLVIRAFGNEKRQEATFEDANNNIRKTNRYVQIVMTTMQPFIQLLLGLTMIAVYYFGARAIDSGSLEVGQLMAYMQYVMQVIQAFMMVSMMFIMVPQALVNANRLKDVLDTNTSLHDPEPSKVKTLGGRAKGEVRFNDVSFKYQDAEACVLEHISFTAKAGEMTAFIGSTGSGKSTLINLVPRFYDVTEGSITLDGVDLRDLTVHELRDNLGYVPQKGILFSGTVASNLSYGKEEATDEEYRRSLQVAQAEDFVFASKNGIETEIDQGGDNVSGGQKQRLSIARALIKNPSVYIFDDSFSALDFKTDAALRRELRKYTTEATVLVVAQRVSTIMNAQQIIVLDAGKIVGRGTHRELLETCEEYREIAESQLSKEELE